MEQYSYTISIALLFVFINVYILCVFLSHGCDPMSGCMKFVELSIL